ncbi:MAG: heat-inducible transcription repressor HrcA [Actinobacteria bacterium]|nr:heat-inducible transcription repressor HrcA [Actinomycetota bacterium]
MRLTDRKKEILKEVVSKFIESAEPISSQNIAENTGLELSPATIRKEMAELEDMGYLTHPHTSAGRIPSDKGYRFFVDNFIKNKIKISSDSQKALARINLDVDKDMELESVLQKSSQQLARLTSYLSMIVAPAVFQSRFRHLEILKFNGGNLLLVLITDIGRVFKRNFIIEGVYNTLDFQSVSNILNQQLRDKNISDIDYSILKISENNSYLIQLIKKIIEIIKSCGQETMLYNRIFIHGTSSVLNQPDFIDLKKIQRILSIIENEYLLLNLLLDISGDDEGLIVKIGSEIFKEGPDDLSLVASKYKIYEHSTGAIGVLGPKRMDYYRVIGIIGAFVEGFKQIFRTKA